MEERNMGNISDEKNNVKGTSSTSTDSDEKIDVKGTSSTSSDSDLLKKSNSRESKSANPQRQEKRKRRKERHSLSAEYRVEGMEERNMRNISDEKNDVKCTNSTSADPDLLKRSNSGQEKRKRRKEKHSLSAENRVEGMEERNMGNISDEKNDVKCTNSTSTNPDLLKKSNSGKEKSKRREEKHSLSAENRVEGMEERNLGNIADEKNDVKCANSTSTDSDLVKKSNSSESKSANSKKHGRHRERVKERPSENGSVASSSLSAVQTDTSADRSFIPGIVGKSHRKKNSIRSAIVDTMGSSEEAGNSALAMTAHADLNKSNMHAEIRTNSDIVENTQCNKSRKAKRVKQKVFLSQYGTEIDQEKNSAVSSCMSDITEIDVARKNNINASIESKSMPIAIKDSGGLIKTLDDESPINNSISSKVPLNQHAVENPRLSQNKEVMGEMTDKSLDILDHDIKQVQDNVPNTLLQLAEIGGADTSDRASASRKVRRRVRKKKASHKRHKERASDDGYVLKNEDFSDEVYKLPQGHSSSAEGDSELLSTNEKETGFPPPPIKGVVDSFASSELPNKQNGQLHLFREDDINFSFHVKNDLMNNISVNHSEKASTSRREAGSANVKPANCKDHSSNVMPLCSHREATCYQDEREAASLSVNHAVGHDFSLDLAKNQDKELDVLHISPGRSLISCSKKKLLVLDLNGVLADIILDYRKTVNVDKWIYNQAVFKRPYCDDFLNFCFEKFDIGIWSSKKKKNVDAMVDYLVGDAKHNLLFCWDRSKCTITGFSTVENVDKPLVLKEMKKLWNKEDPKLPWKKGEYLPSNTLLVDDSPYKALCNPLHTAIFPYSYHFYDEGDNSIGPGGELRVYLEGLAMADNVQDYICANPFGQRAITAANPSWRFYRQIIYKFGNYSSPN